MSEDIHIYSVNGAFVDEMHYLELMDLTAHEVAREIIRDVLETTGITTAAENGTNLYLCKAAADIVAKCVRSDWDGAPRAQLIEQQRCREELDPR